MRQPNKIPTPPFGPIGTTCVGALVLLERFRGRFGCWGEVFEDGGAERADGVVDIQHRELAVGCYIAYRIDTLGVGGAATEGGGVDEDLVFGCKPVGGQPGGVADAACCVDVDVYAHGLGAVVECDERFAAFLGGGGDFVVVYCCHAHVGEVGFCVFADFCSGGVWLAVRGHEPSEELCVSADNGDLLSWVLRCQLACSTG